MEFLDINLTKDLSVLLHAVHFPSTGGFSRELYGTLLWFLKSFKKSVKQENSRSFMNNIL
jgi:hypothetical protein